MNLHNLGIKSPANPPEQNIQSIPLHEKTILVIGPHSGFGSQIVSELQFSGAQVLTAGRYPKAEGSVDFLVDLEVSSEIAKLGNSLRAKEISLDGVVNCTGLAETPNQLSVSEAKEFERVMHLNVTSVYLLVKELQPVLARDAMFIQLAGGGASGPMRFLPAYSASKAGVVRLIETLAQELKDTYIYLNCLGPGPLETRMTAALLSSKEPIIKLQMSELIPGKFGFIDAKHTARCVVNMFGPDFIGISGKFFSSQWDNWADIPNLIKGASCNSASYTLRRVLCLEETQQNYE